MKPDTQHMHRAPRRIAQVCASCGFAANTPEMAQCIQQEAPGARAPASARSSAMAVSGMMMPPQPMRQITCHNINGGVQRMTL